MFCDRLYFLSVSDGVASAAWQLNAHTLVIQEVGHKHKNLSHRPAVGCRILRVQLRRETSQASGSPEIREALKHVREPCRGRDCAFVVAASRGVFSDFIFGDGVVALLQIF